MAVSTCCQAGCDTDTFMCSECGDHCGYIVKVPESFMASEIWAFIERKFTTLGNMVEIWSPSDEKILLGLLDKNDWSEEL